MNKKKTKTNVIPSKEKQQRHDFWLTYNNPWEIHTERPVSIPFWSTFFSFSHIDLNFNVPHDPELKIISSSQTLEVLYSARLWSHGYRCYAPSKDLTFHQYKKISYFNTKKRAQNSNLVRSNLLKEKSRMDSIFNGAQEEFGLNNSVDMSPYYSRIGLKITPYLHFEKIPKLNLCLEISKGRHWLNGPSDVILR